MMSEEEEDGGSYIRHPPSYRSKALNKFIDKLDQRLQSKLVKHPRLERRPGSPRKKPVPELCKKWMVERRNDESQDSSESEATSTSEGHTSVNASDSELM